MRPALTAGLLAVFLTGTPASSHADRTHALVGKPMPELAVKAGKWFNAKPPPTLARLRGRSVLVVLTTLW